MLRRVIYLILFSLKEAFINFLRESVEIFFKTAGYSYGTWLRVNHTGTHLLGNKGQASRSNVQVGSSGDRSYSLVLQEKKDRVKKRGKGWRRRRKNRRPRVVERRNKETAGFHSTERKLISTEAPTSSVTIAFLFSFLVPSSSLPIFLSPTFTYSLSFFSVLLVIRKSS